MRRAETSRTASAFSAASACAAFQRYEQSARGLRIEKKTLELLRNGGPKRDTIADELPIVPEAAGIEALAGGGHCARQVFDRGVIDFQRHAASDGHFARVAQQREAGDVCDRVNRPGIPLFDFG